MKRIYEYFLIFMLFSCVNDTDFAEPIVNCEEPAFAATHSIANIKEMAAFGLVTFSDDIIVEGYIVSTDISGNIYKTISLQDKYQNPTAAIRFAVDKTNLYATYPIGRKVFVKLKGLSMGYTRGTLEIGKAVAAQLERIPSSEVSTHFFRSCETKEIVPKKMDLQDLNDRYVDMLVQIENVQFKNEELGNTFAESNSTNSIDRFVEQVSENCDVISEISMRISGFSNFKSKELPTGKGSVSGVLTKYYSQYQLLLRTIEDVQFSKERCIEVKTVAPTVSYNQIIDLYENKRVEFGVDVPFVFEGYVISSDQEGNFINKLCIQESFENSEGGFQVLIDEENLYEKYQIGDRVYLKLNSLYLDKVDGVFTIGYPDKETVQEIEQGFVENFILKTEEKMSILPRNINLSEVSVNKFQNTLVTLVNVQLKASEVGKAFAYYSGDENGYRNLLTCDEFQGIMIETLGTATFANDKFPTQRGNITGVLYRDNEQLKIQIRNLDDIFMKQPYTACEVVVPKILITEVADPQNDVNARFVELYNAGDKTFVFNGWKLHKYINGSKEPSSGGVDLSGFTLQPNEFFIIANTGFESVFGFAPNIVSSFVSGNGDDVYQLLDENDASHDIFGKIGEDGSGTIWDYIDGKAVRKRSINQPNANFDSNEWDVFSKAKETEQKAPEDFDPKIR